MHIYSASNTLDTQGAGIQSRNIRGLTIDDAQLQPPRVHIETSPRYRDIKNLYTFPHNHQNALTRLVLLFPPCTHTFYIYITVIITAITVFDSRFATSRSSASVSSAGSALPASRVQNPGLIRQDGVYQKLDTLGVISEATSEGSTSTSGYQGARCVFSLSLSLPYYYI